MTLPAGSTDLNGLPMRIRSILRFFDSAQFHRVSGGSVTLPYGIILILAVGEGHDPPGSAQKQIAPCFGEFEPNSLRIRPK